MKTTPVTPDDLRRSVVSVPPLARRADLSLDAAENGRVLAHLRAGGVTTFMYGGNANLYHMGVGEYPRFLDMLNGLARDGDWMLPSVGADFGKAMDQAVIARAYEFPTVMVLPQRFPVTPSGAATGLRKIADAFGRPIVAYVKDLGYIEPPDLGRLARDGVICAVKYAIVRSDPTQDPYLSELLHEVDPAIVISGIGERPAVAHWVSCGLRAFTSGSVCVGPALSTALLRALQVNDVEGATAIRDAFIPLEDLRDGHSPMRILHEAVRLAGIADTGPMLPMAANIEDPAVLAALEPVARALREANDREIAKAA
jgi:4-hydroxy-tetrahydrodipicolinate synthase